MRKFYFCVNVVLLECANTIIELMVTVHAGQFLTLVTVVNQSVHFKVLCCGVTN